MAKSAARSSQAVLGSNIQRSIGTQLLHNGFIHSRLRNSLSVASVEKLVFIKSNMSAFHDMQTAEYYPSDEEGHPSEGDK